VGLKKFPFSPIPSPPVVISTCFRDLADSTKLETRSKCSLVIKGGISFFSSLLSAKTIDDTADVKSETILSYTFLSAKTLHAAVQS